MDASHIKIRGEPLMTLLRRTESKFAPTSLRVSVRHSNRNTLLPLTVVSLHLGKLSTPYSLNSKTAELPASLAPSNRVKVMNKLHRFVEFSCQRDFEILKSLHPNITTEVDHCRLAHGMRNKINSSKDECKRPSLMRRCVFLSQIPVLTSRRSGLCS